MLASDFMSLRSAALERHARDPAKTAAEVQALVQRIRAGDAAREELGAFLGNPLCPPEPLVEHAASPDPYWRKAVARNDGIDATLADKLAGDTDEEVRYYLAVNRTLPPAILSRLAADTSEMVRDTVAWTDSLPDADFNRLVNDPSPKVRATTALQSRISPEALAKGLSFENHPHQSAKALARVGALREVERMGLG